MRALLLVLLMAMAHAAANKKVCIVGAGIAGSSLAYFLRNAPNVDVEVFEARDRVGGRLYAVDFHNVTVNVGGDAYATSNELMMQLQKELQFPLDNNNYNGNNEVWIYDGSKFYAKKKHFISDLEMLAKIEEFRIALKLNYKANVTFTSIDEYVASHLTNYARVASSSFARRLNPDFVSTEWIPITRTIYDQPLSLNLFAGLAAVLPNLETSYSAAGGNDRIVKSLLQHAHISRLHLQCRVHNIILQNNNNSNTYVLLNDVGDVLASQCSHVVIAAPLEMAQLGKNTSFSLPPSRSYHHWWVTLVAASALEPTYFGLPKKNVVADTILTTQNATVNWTMCSVLDKAPDGAKVYKCFSNADISLELPRLFHGLLEWRTHYWDQTFPDLAPPSSSSSYQPVLLGPNVYYLNAIESVGVAMEAGVVAGKNVANLIMQQK